LMLEVSIENAVSRFISLWGAASGELRLTRPSGKDAGRARGHGGLGREPKNSEVAKPRV